MRYWIYENAGHARIRSYEVSLFEALERKFPAAALGYDKWYLIAVSFMTPSHFTPDH